MDKSAQTDTGILPRPLLSGARARTDSANEWAARRGYQVEQEHIVIAGVPVQINPAHNDLAEEAVRQAVWLEVEGVPVRVICAEHLIALYLEPSARTRKRMERVATLLEGAQLDRPRLDSILSRYGLVLPGEGS